uniref:C-type lectin domain-containing protein n=1 Tax=Astyanax mexicanus TaxID=7994 RepID=A0A8B9KIR5_ASTMX
RPSLTFSTHGWHVIHSIYYTSIKNVLHAICLQNKSLRYVELYNITLSHVLRQSDPKNWMDAQKYCREHYVDLASVRNQEQNLEIFRKTSEITAIQFVDGVWGVWIGLHRTRTWSDNSNSSFTYWKQGEPDDVSFSQSGQWTDENCLTALPFFCYSCEYRFTF